MDKQLFEAAIGEVPPSTVDVDAIIARERRAGWVRRAANPWVASAAAVVAVTIGAAVLLPGDDEGGSALVGAQPTTRPPALSTTPLSPPPCDLVSRRAAPPTTENPPGLDERAAMAARLTAALGPAVRAVLRPGSQLTASASAVYPEGRRHGPLEVYYVVDPAGPKSSACDSSFYTARANVVGRTGTGNLMVVIGVAGLRTKCDPGIASTQEASCEEWTSVTGGTIVATTRRLESGALVNRVDVTHLDNTMVTIQAENVADDAAAGVAPPQSDPPLDHKQLVEIAMLVEHVLSP